MLNDTGSKDLTMLEPNIIGMDPDMAFSRVPYEKGSLFLHYLEQVVGGEDPMSAWLKTYFAVFEKKSIQVEDFKSHFCAFFEGRGVDVKAVDWELWLHGTGIPEYDIASKVDQTLLNGSKDLADKWLVAGTAVMAVPLPTGVAADDIK